GTCADRLYWQAMAADVDVVGHADRGHGEQDQWLGADRAQRLVDRDGVGGYHAVAGAAARRRPAVQLRAHHRAGIRGERRGQRDVDGPDRWSREADGERRGAEADASIRGQSVWTGVGRQLPDALARAGAAELAVAASG